MVKRKEVISNKFIKETPAILQTGVSLILRVNHGLYPW